jgi:hypothetical protein
MSTKKEATKKSNAGLIAGLIGGIVAIIAIVAIIVVIVINNKANVVGTWSLVGMKEGENEFSTEQLKEYNLTGTIEFKEDGTVIIKMHGEADKKFSYDKDKQTIEDGEGGKYKIDGKKLIVDNGDGLLMTFEK